MKKWVQGLAAATSVGVSATGYGNHAAYATDEDLGQQSQPSGGAVQSKPTDIEKVFSGIAITDQTGKAPDMAFLAKGQCIVLFGYGNCPVCAEITKTVAATQKKLLAKGMNDVPIVVVSVQPEKDRDNMAFYISGYHQAGIRQFADERLPEDGEREATGREMIAQAGKRPAGERLLHVLCPADAQAAQEMQRRIAAIAGTTTGIDEKNTRQHSMFLTLMDQGRVVKPSDGPFKGVQLNRKTGQFEAPESLVKKQSDRMVKEVANLRDKQKQSAPQR